MNRKWTTAITATVVGAIVLAGAATRAQVPAEAPASTHPAIDPLPATQPSANAGVTPEGPSVLPALEGRPDQPAPDTMELAPLIISQAAGIGVRPPAGCKRIERAGGDAVFDFVNEKQKISFRVSRTQLPKPLKLLNSPTDPTERGLFDMTVDQTLIKLPNHKVLRRDVVPVAGHDGGLFIARAVVGVQNQFIQQAIIQANEQLYFTVALVTPGQAPSAPADQPNPVEAQAARAFQSILDSIEILDQEKLRRDQEQRLYRTRSLYVNWTEAKLRSVLIPEQWLRVMRNGKDVGYSYIVESTEMRGTTPRVKIGIRSRTVLEVDQIDAETWYHVAFDRKIENWSSIALFTTPKEKYHLSEFGSSEQRRKPIADPTNIEPAGRGDNVGVKLVDTYSLSVHSVAKKVTAPPLERDLPPFYLPQALSHLLPRLLPLNEPRGYLFATYVSSDREVKLRYVDVGAFGDFVFAGQKIRATPITERIGLDGAPTVHYVAKGGVYLGNETTVLGENSAKATITVLLSDAPTLTGLWKNANLTAPAAEDKPVIRE